MASPAGGGGLSDHEVYNIVSDVVVGVNLRRRDNLWQLAAIVLCALLGAVTGAWTVRDRLAGAIAGAIGGLVIGLFRSGTFLMVYRLVCHARGNHR